MAKIINLKHARKSRARDAARQKADENARLYGRTAMEKAQDDRNISKLKTHLDQHRLSDPDDEA